MALKFVQAGILNLMDISVRIPKILCVEDNKESREMMRELLLTSDNEYSITLVETGAEALDLMGRTKFDLYILDIWLPGMDGVDLCRRIRALGISEPIMFFSAMVRPDDLEYGLAAGANEFLVKPRDVEILVDTVDRLLYHADSVSFESI